VPVVGAERHEPTGERQPHVAGRAQLRRGLTAQAQAWAPIWAASQGLPGGGDGWRCDGRMGRSGTPLDLAGLVSRASVR
jgi:hypothetical protein